MSYSSPQPQPGVQALQKIREQAQIYGRDPKKAQNLTEYQKRINQCSEGLCTNNPNLLSDRKLLLERAREQVHEMGFAYKKGKSRSKRINPPAESDAVAIPKRRKVSSGIRLMQIAELQERIADIKDQIGFKEKRRESAQLSHNYKECDKLTEQMSTLRSEKRQLEFELSSLQKKEHKSKWYFSRKGSLGEAAVSSESDSSAQRTPIRLFTPPPSRATRDPSLAVTSRKQPVFSPPPKSPSPAFSPSVPSSSSCFTTPSPRPIALPPHTPASSQFTSTPSPGDLSESVEQETDIVSLSTDEDVPGYDQIVIPSDEYSTDGQPSPYLDTMSSPTSPLFQ